MSRLPAKEIEIDETRQGISLMSKRKRSAELGGEQKERRRTADSFNASLINRFASSTSSTSTTSEYLILA